MSEQKRYTAQEMRKMADCINNIKQSEMPSWKEGEIITGGDLCRSADMLRQAADAEEELANLKTTSGELEKRALEYADQVVSSPLLTNTIKRLIAERNSLMARLEAVVNMLSNVYHDCRYSNAVSMFKEEYDAILRAARGETSRNGNNSGNSSENRNIKGSDNGK